LTKSFSQAYVLRFPDMYCQQSTAMFPTIVYKCRPITIHVLHFYWRRN